MATTRWVLGPNLWRLALACGLSVVVCIALALPAPADAASETIDKIAKSGTIVIGHKRASRPFSYVDEAGKPVGYSIDLCLRVAKAVEEQLGKSIAVKYVEVESRERIDRLRDGAIDLECGNSTRTLARQAEVDFSSMIFVTGGGLLSRAESNIHSMADLQGRRISVVAGTTTEAALREKLTEARIDATVIPLSNHQEGLAALSEEKIDTHVGDRIVLIGLWKSHPTPDQFLVASELFTYEPYALMMRQGDPKFRLIVDSALARLYRSGGIIEIYSRWFGQLGAPSELLRYMYALQGFPE